MKVTVTMKTPDAMDYAIENALENNQIEEDREYLAEEIREKLGHWFKCSEYMTVEFDTVKMTATVLSAK